MTLDELGSRARQAASVLAGLPSELKRAALESAAQGLLDGKDDQLAANGGDVERARAAGITGALLDRLTLTGARIAQMAQGLRSVAAQPDPVGEVIDSWTRPNGLSISKVRVPVGVVAVIYEARPNVTADVAGLCLMSGNAAVLRGSSHALDTNRCVARTIREAIARVGAPADSVQLVEDTSRDGAIDLMKLDAHIDLLIPRGGAALIESIRKNATVPYIIDGDGNCHVYVDQTADPQMARSIVLNAKTQRPGVCNAAETLLVHRSLIDSFLPDVCRDLADAGVEIRGDETVREVWPEAKPATEQDWATEFLDLIIAVKVVSSLDEAIDHIARYGTSNAEAIITGDETAATRFTQMVDAGSVFVNASTRFSDGGEFGFGAEIGISTQKLHARGPMGLNELTTYKYIVRGEGQVRT